MLTFRNTSLAAVVTVVIVVPVIFFYPPALYLLSAVLLAYAVLLVIGSVFVCSGFYIPAVCLGNTAENAVALTFDDGPDERITPMILDILDKHQIPGTFFCIGSKAALNPGIVRRIAAEGHLLGNHSDSHGFLFDFKPYRRLKDDLQQAENVITGITGMQTRWLRPPYGVTNPSLGRASRKLQYRVAGWTIRTKDSTTRGHDKVMEQIRKKWQPGAIIMLHDTHMGLPKLLEDIVSHAATTGYRFARLDEITREKPYKS